MVTSIIAPLLVSSLIFLGTAGYLVINANALMRLLGRSKRPSTNSPGELLKDGQGRSHEPSRGAIIAVLTLHVLGAAGMVASAVAGIVAAHAG